MALTNAERQARWRERHRDDDVIVSGGHDARTVIGGRYLAPRETVTLRTRQYVGVVHECATHGRVVFVDITNGRRVVDEVIDGERVVYLAPIVAERVADAPRDDAYADGHGRCHDGGHATRPCVVTARRRDAFGGLAEYDGQWVMADGSMRTPIESTRVGTFVARTNVRGVDTAATRRAHDLNAAHADHVAECSTCRTAGRMTTWTNATREYIAPLPPNRATRDANASLHGTRWPTAAERERRAATRAADVRAHDELMWAREYAGVIA